MTDTHVKFFAVVDSTVTEVGLTMDEVTAKIIETKRIGTLEACSLRDKYLEPIYIALRRKGYNIIELWG